MKKAILTGMALSVAISNIYPSVGVVTNVNEGVVTYEDADGQLWSFKSDIFEKGDLVATLMYNNGTPEKVEDDIILSAYYKGKAEMYILP